MGFSINKLRKQVEENDKVLVTIIIDGEENSSIEYDAASIKALEEDLKKAGWCFTYIGASQNVVEAASVISIKNCLHFDATQEGTHQMFDREKKARTRFFYRTFDRT